MNPDEDADSRNWFQTFLDRGFSIMLPLLSGRADRMRLLRRPGAIADVGSWVDVACIGGVRSRHRHADGYPHLSRLTARGCELVYMTFVSAWTSSRRNYGIHFKATPSWLWACSQMSTVAYDSH